MNTDSARVTAQVAQSNKALDLIPQPGTASMPSLGETSDYWYGLIDENEAAAFRKVTRRKMQLDRQTGEGPKFIRISARCIRYRRIDLHQHNEARLRSSTAEAAA